MEEYENGITFTDEEAAEEVEKQLQDAEDALKFENSDADTVAKEFEGVASRCRNCIKKLDELYNGGSSFESARYALDAFRAKDMFPMGGYIPLFSTNKANKKLFESPVPNLSPDFTKGKMLYLDSVEFKPLFEKTCVMLTALMDLKSLFAFKMAYDNFTEAHFDNWIYNNYKEMIRQASVCITDEGMPASAAVRSEQFYQLNRSEMSDKEMAMTYWELRKEDYRNWLYNDVRNVFNLLRGSGPFTLNEGIASTLQVIDRYTHAVYEQKDAEAGIKKVIELNGNLLTLSSTLIDKIKHPSSKNVLLTLGQLYKKLCDIAEEALEHYTKFLDSDDAPYIYMKYPTYIHEGWFAKTGCAPSNSGGWDGGTKYHECIRKLVETINDHFKDTVYQKGRIKR